MVKIKAFKGVCPPAKYAKEVASRPYDVLSSKEAKAEAGEKSLLHIIKPEIDFDPIAGEYEQRVYDRGVENFKKWRERNWLVQDETENYYIYAQTMNGRTQYGLAACCHYQDYLDGKIKKHELTRPDKEEDRMKHVRNQSANIEPVFFSYPAVKEMDDLVENIVKNNKPEFDFVAEDGFGHQFWRVADRETVNKITALFAKIPALYIADGHHRSAAAALVGQERAKANPNHKGDEEYCYFLTVIFPDDQLTIIDYNRAITDLNGHTAEQLIELIEKDFDVEKVATTYKPNKLHNFGMYLGGQWYSLTAKQGRYDDNDPIGVLDVTILSDLVLDKILGIEDLRRSNKIDFIGGIRGLGELEQRVDSGKMAVAFSLYPVTMKQLIHISDTNNIMPPKTTWFEPKLRSGVVIHTFDE